MVRCKIILGWNFSMFALGFSLDLNSAIVAVVFLHLVTKISIPITDLCAGENLSASGL